MIENSQLSSKLRGKLWPEVSNTDTYLDNFFPVEGSQQGSDSNFLGRDISLLLTHQKYLENIAS